MAKRLGLCLGIYPVVGYVFFGDHMMTQVMKTTDYSRDTVPPFQILTKTFLDTLTMLFRIQIMEHRDLTPREDAL